MRAQPPLGDVERGRGVPGGVVQPGTALSVLPLPTCNTFRGQRNYLNHGTEGLVRMKANCAFKIIKKYLLHILMGQRSNAKVAFVIVW